MNGIDANDTRTEPAASRPSVAAGTRGARTARFLRAARIACRGLADAWLARTCFLCDQALVASEDGLCAHCESDLPGARCARCPVCAARAEAPRQPCAGCERAAPAYDRTVVLADYAPPLDRALLALKFGGEIALAAPLGRALGRALCPAPGIASARAPGPALAALEPADWLTAVPLAPRRLAERGFNQSAVIARAAAGEVGARFESRVLRKTRESPPQSSLALADRRANLESVFAARGDLRNRTIVVVDDVMTSGATLHACALALKTAGAQAVINLVVARTR
ncbi:MAG: ComF family protein [Burkholderiaceae bacterium]|nr:ComF family protein [Burkholderiaceae bacterium]